MTTSTSLWTHNDGGAPEVFAIDASGRLLGTYGLPGYDATDLEDIGAGPGPDPCIGYVSVADIGDNNGVRPQIQVVRFPDPAVYGRQQDRPVARDLKGVEVITLTYPDGPRDAETLFVDPISGDLFVVSKAMGQSRVYRAPAVALVDGARVEMTHVGTIGLTFGFQLLTGGDISATGREIAVRGYTFARLWTRDHDETVAEAIAAPHIDIPFVSFPAKPQGEALGFDGPGDGYYTVSEGLNQPLHYFARTSDDGPPIPTTLVPAGAAWTYLDDGTDLGTAWREPDFDDGAWPSGDAQFGYGDDDEETVVDFGGDPAQKHVTTYFRTSFALADPAAVESLLMRLLYDDGAAVYINGTEVARVNLDADVGATDLAAAAQTDLEDAWRSFSVSRLPLVAGTNVIAVEVHQVASNDDDLSFDLQLISVPVDRPGDIDGDGAVDVIDLLFMLGAWAPCDDPCPRGCPADIERDGVVDTRDLLRLLGDWG